MSTFCQACQFLSTTDTRNTFIPLDERTYCTVRFFYYCSCQPWACLLALRRDFLIGWDSAVDMLTGCSSCPLHLPSYDPVNGLPARRRLLHTERVDKVAKHVVGAQYCILCKLSGCRGRITRSQLTNPIVQDYRRRPVAQQ